MTINSELFDELAAISKLSFTDIEKEKMMKELNEMIEFLMEIEKIETEEQEVNHFLSNMKLQRREDEPEDTLNHDEILMNAPNSQEGFFVVPRIIKE